MAPSSPARSNNAGGDGADSMLAHNEDARDADAAPSVDSTCELVGSEARPPRNASKEIGGFRLEHSSSARRAVASSRLAPEYDALGSEATDVIHAPTEGARISEHKRSVSWAVAMGSDEPEYEAPGPEAIEASVAPKSADGADGAVGGGGTGDSEGSRERRRPIGFMASACGEGAAGLPINRARMPQVMRQIVTRSMAASFDEFGAALVPTN